MNLKHKDIRLNKAKKNFSSFFVKNDKIAILALVGIFILGLSSAIQVPKESAPQIDFGIINISTFYDGASAVDIDSLVTQEIENKIKDTDGINKINSLSKNNFSSITVELKPDVNMIKAVNDLRSKIDEAKGKLPSNAEEPVITEINSTSDSPFFTVNLVADKHPALLRDYAEDMKKKLEAHPYVSNVDIQGGSERKIYVDLDPLKLSQYEINADTVRSAIVDSNRNFPLGNFAVDGMNYSLRFEGKHENAEDIRDVSLKVIKKAGGYAQVKIADIAKVYEKEDEIDNYESFTDLKNNTAKTAVRLIVKKGSGFDIFKADPAIKEVISDFVKKELNNDVSVYYSREELENVSKSYRNVYQSGGFSVVIVFIVLLLFLGTKEAMSASLIIPLSFLSTITVIKMMGGTLNFMVNFSMVLALGILVDTSIVIVEGIHDAIKLGYSGKEAAMISVEEFKKPLISGMLTTLAVFLPLFSLPDILGKYLSHIPISVSITLSASLLIALLLIPSLAAKIMDNKDKEEKKDSGFFITKYIKKYHYWHNEIMLPKLLQTYKKFTFQNLKSRKKRIWSVYGVFFLFILSFMIPVKFSMFPAEDISFFFVNLKTPEGYEKEETLKLAKRVEPLLLTDFPEIKSLETSINGNEGQISVNLYPEQYRKDNNFRNSIDTAEAVREKLNVFKNNEVSVRELSNGPPSDSPVAFKVIMDKPELLSEATKVVADFKEILRNIPGTDNIKDDSTHLPGEITYSLNRAEAIRLGLNPYLVSNTIKSAVSGNKAITITRGGREVDVEVRYEDTSINNFDDLDNLQIIDPQGDSISVSQVVDRKLSGAFEEIRRSDGKVAIKVSSDLSKEGNAADLTTKFKEKISDYEFPEGIRVEDAGENAENSELFIALGTGFLMAVFMIFTILVVQFNSYAQPFIIIFTIVMSILGVNIGLFLTGTPRSLAFIIGVISLGGIVVNDAIILVDRINTLRELSPDKDLKEIISKAGASRLQPIVLTTITTIAGVAPLIFVSTFWAGLAITVIFGLMFASSLTLILTPMMYYQFEKDLSAILLPPMILFSGLIFLVSIFKLNIFLILIFGFLTRYLYKKLLLAKKFLPLQ